MLCGKKNDDDSDGGKLVGHRFSLETEENSPWASLEGQDGRLVEVTVFVACHC